MPVITKIAITGGPCAGKTTALGVIRKMFPQRGYKVITVPEPATEFISNGIAPWDCSSSEEYQRCQMEVQLTREAMYERAARGMAEDKVLMVFDRGMLDNKCYMTAEEFDRVIADLGTTEAELVGNYDAVFHLVSAAKGAPEFYSKETNGTRYESLEEAAELDDHFIDAWAAHPSLHVIGNEGNFDHKLNNFVRELDSVLEELEDLRTACAGTSQENASADYVCDCPMYIREFTGADFEPLSHLLGDTRHAQHGARSYWQGSDELCAHLSHSDVGFVAVDKNGDVQGVVLVEGPCEENHNRDMRMHWLQQRSYIAAMANALGIKSRADASAAEEGPRDSIVLLELSPQARAAGIEQALMQQAQEWLNALE